MVLLLLNVYVVICVCRHVHIDSNCFVNVYYSGHIKNRVLNVNKYLCPEKNCRYYCRKNCENNWGKKLFLVQKSKEIIIGTRDSPLAIKQSEKVKIKLLTYFKKIKKNVKVILKTIKTTGDQILDKNVGLFGGKGIFTKELDEQLIKNNVHMCVHSLKDVPLVLPEHIHLSCFLKRDTINDVFLSMKYKSLSDMNKSNATTVEIKSDDNDNDRDKIEEPEQQKRSSVYKNEQKNSSCTVATSSLRRRSQIKNIYKNVKIENIRGNINTRITKLFNGQYDSIVIALCGLERLLTKEIIQDIIKNKKSSIPSKQHIISYNNTDIDLSLFSIQKISTKIIYPALCQGIIAVTSNDENSEITHILKSINDKKSEIMANIERAFLYQTEGNCMMPIGGFTKIVRNKIFFNAIINDIHGHEKYKVKEIGHASNYNDIAIRAARNIKQKMGIEKFRKIKEEAAVFYTE
ncbi:porphobilinogen deaminase, putative [Plasmodium malariae]|uniref:hydroxymethylbilane synthase n=1 Tax=Plasmodium malariae TaxID=5858 RepID=A0A1D3TCD6_PLAMA|nr:porphobilinogen deaminase, putative [Plasmodium malariae]SCP02548.1 porphobilinogen deaminase, putative [Plasmodium malariae]